MRTEVGLSVVDALEGRRILLCGGTGFLGKVFASLLLDRFPEVGHVYLLVRSAGDARRRFREELLPSPAFDPLRQRYGARLERYLEEKLTVVEGDVGEPALGMADDVAARIAADCDVVVNAAGHVVFNAPLDAALRANVSGPRHALAFARRLRRPALVHVSTCYVAGDRDGERREDDPLVGFHPRREEGDPPLSAEAEITQCERLLARVHEEAEDPSLEREFEAAARRRSLEEGKDPKGARGRAALAQERKAWVRRRLVELGAERAKRWGWPNVYVYTKSLGEQLVAASTGVVRAIVRPAIIESALGFPHVGWNEGFTTTAPLLEFAIRGHSHFPVRRDVILDLVPVDAVASVLTAVTAQACVEEPPLVHQVSTSDRNPLRLERAGVLMELYRRRRSRRPGAGAAEKLAGRVEIRIVDPDRFEKVVLPVVKAAAEGAARVLERVESAPLGITSWVRQAQTTVARWQDEVRIAEGQIRTFRPYMADRHYVFRTDNVRALFRRLPRSERGRIEWDPEAIDWADYWVNVHCPGLERWVFAKRERPERVAARRPAHRTLVELFDAATRTHAARVALAVRRDGREERYTYAEVRECALRAAVFLRGLGVARGDKVALLAENAPEWGMAYFGVLRCGAACVPLAADAPPGEVAPLLARSQAKVLLLGEAQAGRRRELQGRLREEGLSVRIVSLDELFALAGREEEREGIAGLPPAPGPDDAASILFTSGTTGGPQGVVLSHRNLASQVTQLLAVYDLDHRDGMLSLLPLHHSFELSAGLLMPLSRGARITYITELSAGAIASALRSRHVTCVIGVPALWDLLRRRLLGGLHARSPRLGQLASGLIALNRRLRDETPLNLGPLMFAPVHFALGGRIRYLISGGGALSRESLETFRGLGFELLEGHGLAEAAPVLTALSLGERGAAVDAGRAPDTAGTEPARAAVPRADAEIRVPSLVAALGRRGYRMAERLVYDGVLQARFRGRRHVPRDGPFIVAANHLSHLDAGLVRIALGRSGERLFVLAAADTFFDTALKRAFFSHFAGLLPLERGAPNAESLRRAVETIEKGYSVLVFPEGTRSRSGGLQEFRRGVGYLALRARVGVLPVQVDTYRALPAGSLTLKSRRVEARIGPFLGYEDLARPVAGRARADAEREVTRMVREAIERLGPGRERRPVASLLPEAVATEVEVE